MKQNQEKKDITHMPNEYENMDGLQVLWHLLTTEPFFWVLLGIGFGALALSIWFDRWNENADYSVYK